MFISFEGGEGAGKTTQAGLLHSRLCDLEIPCDLVREPGGTTLGEYLRNYLKSDQPLTPEAELLLFEAARVELVANRIHPALNAGKTVIADRFSDSTVAYQGYGRGIDLGVITPLNGFATLGLSPDLVFLLDVAPEVGLRRTVGHQMAFWEDAAGQLAPLNRNNEGRRFEDLELAFHHKVQKGFLAQAKASPERWVVIDGARPVEEVSGEVWRHVRQRLGLAEEAKQPSP